MADQTRHANWRIAVHEAGHTVVCIVQGVKVLWVTVEARADYLGRTEPDYPDAYRDKNHEDRADQLKIQAAVAYAGVAAEREFDVYEQCLAVHWKEGDYGQAEGFIRELTDSTVEADQLSLELRARAQHLVREYRSEVESLAGELCEAGTVIAPKL